LRHESAARESDNVGEIVNPPWSVRRVVQSHEAWMQNRMSEASQQAGIHGPRIDRATNGKDHDDLAETGQDRRAAAAMALGLGRDLIGDAFQVKPGAPLILACNHLAYAAQPTLLAAWRERWRMQGADPPQSETAVAELLAEAGFEPPLRFFSSLFWGARMTKRRSMG
jgi:hypothetical protein